MEQFWKEWLKNDDSKRVEQLKIIVDTLERHWESIDEVKDKLKEKGIDIKSMKSEFLNKYFEDLLYIKHNDK
jgi:hypothetical protein